VVEQIERGEIVFQRRQRMSELYFCALWLPSLYALSRATSSPGPGAGGGDLDQGLLPSLVPIDARPE
jgi:hypothetical protein